MSSNSYSRPRSIEEVVQDANWLAHRYDPGHDAIHFVPVPRAAHDRLTFLNDEYLPRGLERIVVSRSDAAAAAPLPAPLHFIFHSAFCCSTLLARAFDIPSHAMGLKEPFILNDIVGWRRRGGQGPDMASVLNDVLAMLARPYAPREAIIVKPSTIAHVLIAPILTLLPNSKALFLHASLRTYLGSIARKNIDGRLWARSMLLGLMDDKLIDIGFSPRDFLGQTDLQVAAAGWLAQRALFENLTYRFGAARLRTLDSEMLTNDPAAALGALSNLFEMSIGQFEIDGVITGPAFSRHSKSGVKFGMFDRQMEDRSGTDLHLDEIEKVVLWTEAVAEAAGISLVASSPLLRSAAG